MQPLTPTDPTGTTAETGPLGETSETVETVETVDLWDIWQARLGFADRQSGSWSPKDWHWGATHPHPEIRRLTAKRHGLPRWWRLQLSQDTDPRVRRAVLEHDDRWFADAWMPQMTPLATDPDPGVRRLVAGWAGVPPALAHQLLFADPDAEVREDAVRHWGGLLGEGHLVALLLDPAPAVRRAAVLRREATRSSTVATMVAELVDGDPEAVVREMLDPAGVLSMLPPVERRPRSRRPGRRRHEHLWQELAKIAQDLRTTDWTWRPRRLPAPVRPAARKRPRRAPDGVREEPVAPVQPPDAPAALLHRALTPPPSGGVLTPTVAPWRALWALTRNAQSTLTTLESWTTIPETVLCTWLLDPEMGPQVLARPGWPAALLERARTFARTWDTGFQIAVALAGSPALSPAGQSALSQSPHFPIRRALAHAHLATLPADALLALAADPVAEIRGHVVGLRRRGWPRSVLAEICRPTPQGLHVSTTELLRTLAHAHATRLPPDLAAEISPDATLNDETLAPFAARWLQYGRAVHRRLLAAPHPAVRLAMIRALGAQASAPPQGSAPDAPDEAAAEASTGSEEPTSA